MKFLKLIFTVFLIFMAAYLGRFFPKKSQDIWRDIYFFWWYLFFFVCQLNLHLVIVQKKVQISQKKSRYHLNFWTSEPNFGIKRGYQKKSSEWLLNFSWEKKNNLYIFSEKWRKKIPNSSEWVPCKLFRGKKIRYLCPVF